ncbi:MAG: SxtJ family membrane protein [Gemmatimonadaceae bacterium]
MASPAPTRLTRAQGMKFAFTLAAAFSVLSVVLAWRQRTLGAEVAFGLGFVLLVAGVAVPSHLGPVERVWMGFGRILSRVTAPIALGIVYFIALTPIAYVRRTFGRSPLARDPSASTYWTPRAPRDVEERHRALERQF